MHGNMRLKIMSLFCRNHKLKKWKIGWIKLLMTISQLYILQHVMETIPCSVYCVKRQMLICIYKTSTVLEPCILLHSKINHWVCIICSKEVLISIYVMPNKVHHYIGHVSRGQKWLCNTYWAWNLILRHKIFLDLLLYI